MNTTTFWIQIVIGCIWLVSDYISYAILYSLRKTERGNIFFIGFLLDPITFLLTLAVIKFGIFGEMLVPLQVFAHLISIAKLLPYFCFTYLFFSRNFDKVFLYCILLMISMDALSLLAVVKIDREWKFGLFYLMYYIKIGFSFVFAITFLGFRYRKKIDFKKQSTL